MTSSATTRNRFEKQATGDNSNTWGTHLNAGIFDILDTALDGRTAFTLSGTKTLTSTNYVADESRSRFLDITGGSGGTVTIPAVEKLYFVRNATSGSVIITTGGGGTATIATGKACWVACDATNVRLDTTASDAASSASAAASSASAAAGSASAAASSASAASTSASGASTSASNAASSASAAAASAASINPATIVQWAQLGSTVATTSGSTATISSIDQTYRDLFLSVEGVSTSAATEVKIAFSADGASFSAVASMVSPISTSDSLYGGVSIPRYRGDCGVAIPAVANGASPSTSQPGTNPIAWRITGGIQAIRLSVASGTFDAGAIKLYAR